MKTGNEKTAYAPLLHLLAKEGMDTLLVKMPFRMAIFGINKADDLISDYNYTRWYISGHSLGGAMAAFYAADHETLLNGLVLLAAYPTKKIDGSLAVTTIFGSEDHVLNMTNLEKGRVYLPEKAAEYRIDGGNHAQFGNYGVQKGDGEALISAAEQQKQMKALILSALP